MSVAADHRRSLLLAALGFLRVLPFGLDLALLLSWLHNWNGVGLIATANAGMHPRFQETQLAAQALGLALASVTVQSPDDFERIFGTLSSARPESLLVLADTVTIANRQRTIEFAANSRVPAIYETRAFVDAGGLMSYGVDMSDHYRRAAVYVDKILKGANPANLPVEQPTKFELVINMKTAKALGLTIPPSLLLRADQVIE